jgi:hypothetical protein
MDQNKSEGRAPFQPVNRGNFMPTGRTFGAPAPTTPAPQPVATEPEQRVVFTAQQFSAPTPAPVPPVAKPLSFAPPTEAKPASKLRFKSTTKIRAIAAGMMILLLLAGGVQHHLTQSRKHVLGVKTHGRKIPVAEATVAEGSLETSCYTLNVPNQYQVTHTAGCSSVITATKAVASNISLVSTPSSSTFTMQDAPAQIKEQLKLLGSSVIEFKTEPTTVNNVKALKVLYQLGKGTEQALVFVPGLPAKYVSGTDAAGAFMIRGTYGTVSQQAAFDNVLSSLKWER